MAGAPGELRTPLDLATPAKMGKSDPSCLETSPAVWSKWSTLPDDLACRIGNCFLDNNDLDYYMCFRAVCPSWRAATDDPRKDTREPRFCHFQPLAWIVLDDDFHGDDMRVLVNTLTGRFLRKKLPLLLDYYVVGTSRGFIVLAHRSPPHAASVLNPLTGYMLRLAVPVPPQRRILRRCTFADSSLKLTLFCDSSRTIYTAAPDSESFLARPTPTEDTTIRAYAALYRFYRKAAVAGIYLDIFLSGSSAFAAMNNFILKCLEADLPVDLLVDLPAEDLPGDTFSVGGFIVDLVGHMLFVLKPQGGLSPFVFKVDIETGELVPLKRISIHAIFIGDNRCFALQAHKFPGIEANCVYFTENLGSSAHICKCSIQDQDSKVERISEDADFVKQGNKFVLIGDPPFSTIQRLSSYTINSLDSQLLA